MAALEARLCEVGNFILFIAVVLQLLHRVEVEVGGFVAGGQALRRVFAEGGVRLDL